MPPKKDEDSLQGIMESIAVLANAVQQQQKQLNDIMGIFGGGNVPGEQESDIGPTLKDDGNAKVQTPTYPYQYGDDKARSKLVDLCFNTPRDKLPELTETPRMQVTPTAWVETINEFINNMGKAPEEQTYEPFDAIFIRKRDQRMKSVGRKSLMEAMAFSQIQEEKTEIGEGQQMGF